MRLDRRVTREARLANARLAGDEGDPAGTLARLVEQVRKTLPLCAATDVSDRWHLAQPWRQRDRAELGGGRLPDHLERGEWLREALQGEVAGGSELATLARHHPDQFPAQDLSAGRGVAEPRCLHHGRPEVVVVLVVCLTGRDADPHHHLLVGPAIATVEALLHADRAFDRARRALEHDHQAVADVLHLVPAGGLDGLA